MNASSQELVWRIESRADELARRSVQAACTGPFWDERFGERGRRYIDEDAGHHIDQLLTALKAGHPSVFARYARWLQSVLTHRGMCTRHIEEHLQALADAIDDVGIVDAGRPRAYVEAGIHALLYGAAPARTVQDRADGLAANIEVRTTRLERLLPPQRVRRDASFLLSYLSDALALESPQVFVDYAVWIAPFHARHGASSRYLASMLAALDEALRTLPDSDRVQALEPVASAMRAVLQLQ